MGDEKAEYDANEAIDIFHRAAARQRPDVFREERTKAAIVLLRAVKAAAEGAGYSVIAGEFASTGELAFGAHGLGAARVGVGSGVPWIRPADSEQPGKPLPIQYDPHSKSFVGETDDDSYCPRPGERRPKRNAVAVVAEEVVRVLDENRSRPRS